MVFAPELRTHVQHVCSLYKAALRHLEAVHVARHVVRFHQVQLRKRFDESRCICDPKEQRRLLWVGQNELFQNRYPFPPAKFPTSIGIAGGVAYKRDVIPPDWILDYWHPLEKAQYPEYFARRECRKCVYIDYWQKNILM